MSSKKGLVLPSEVFPNAKELKTLFSMRIRISVTLKAISAAESIKIPGDVPIEGETLEYQFIMDDVNTNNINCVFCKSVLGDFLGFCGLKYIFDDFVKFYEESRVIKNNVTFEKIRVACFPFAWYDCFEENTFDERKWGEVRNTILSLKTITDIERARLAGLDKIL